MGNALAGIRQKILRAQKHLDDILLLLTEFVHGVSELRFEDDPNAEHYWLRYHWPAPPEGLETVIGDCLFNIRSALDHFAWQLVLANRNSPSAKTMFPVCSTVEAFAGELRRHRLEGMSREAQAAIESLQPYAGRENPLRLIHQLQNIDKHRALNLLTVIASDAHMVWERDGNVFFESFIGNDELRDGAILAGIPKAMLPHASEVKVQVEAALYVAFEEPAAGATAEEWETFRVDGVLGEGLDFVRNTVFPALEPFFD